MTYVAQLFDICRTLHAPIFLHEVYFIGWFYKLALSDCGSIFRGQFVCERKKARAIRLSEQTNCTEKRPQDGKT